MKDDWFNVDVLLISNLLQWGVEDVVYFENSNKCWILVICSVHCCVSSCVAFLVFHRT